MNEKDNNKPQPTEWDLPPLDPIARAAADRLLDEKHIFDVFPASPADFLSTTRH